MTAHTDPWSHGHEGPGLPDDFVHLLLDRVWGRFTSDDWTHVTCAQRDEVAGLGRGYEGVRSVQFESRLGEAVVTEWSGPDGPIVLDVVGAYCWHLVPPGVLQDMARAACDTARE